MEKNECIKSHVKYAKELREKSINKDWKNRQKKMKENLKTKQDYEKELETIFNKYIRLRDEDKPCISCQAPAGSYTLTAGHYYPAGSYKNIRFDEDNVWGQCWYNCNKNRHGNLAEYRINLIERIGIKRVEALDQKRLIPAHFTISEIEEMKKKYKQKARALIK